MTYLHMTSLLTHVLTCCNIGHSYIYIPSAIEKMALHIRVLMFIAFLALLWQEIKGKSCVVDSDCPVSNVCCDYSCVFGSDCSGQTCTWNSDCNGLYCCNDICQYSCLGHYCSFDMDCGGSNENCCSNTCQDGTCLAGWAIALIVIASLAVFGIILGVMLCWCCSYRRSNPGHVFVNPPINPAPRAAVVTGSTVNYGTVYPAPNAPPPPYYHQPTQR